MSVPNLKYDCVVIGAGPAGLSTAIRLAMGDRKVAVIERIAMPRDKVCGGFIGYENRGLLERYGVWDTVLRRGERLKNIFLSAGKGAAILLENEDRGYGIGMSRRLFDQILEQRARELGVDVFDQTMCTVRDSEAGKICDIKLFATGEVRELQTSCVVQASGARKKQFMGKPGFGGYALFENTNPGRGDVAVYFVDGGHLGINRFEDGKVNACYFVDAALFRRCGSQMESVFEHFLSEHEELRWQFQGAERITPFKGVSGGRVREWSFLDCNQFIVGDGVAVINPVVGGGNSIALASGCMLAEEILDAGENLDIQGVAERYERRWRQIFARRIRQSWFWGELSHRRILAWGVLKIFYHHKAWLRGVYQTYHDKTNLQCETAG